MLLKSFWYFYVLIIRAEWTLRSFEGLKTFVLRLQKCPTKLKFVQSQAYLTIDKLKEPPIEVLGSRSCLFV
ncbi:MAG: hypothetical protein DMF69_02190 [Acidobacteria bacterium]|nr:MAG: hypothetical protein DMF69_02190 [Acidobacteriota bacterium]